MPTVEQVHARLGATIPGSGGAIDSANRLCVACVTLLEVDGAAISIVNRGVSWGTFGSSSELSRHLDQMQFTLGEGPCLDAVQLGRPVLVSDIADPQERRWPAFDGALRRAGVQSVFALPVSVATSRVGALELFRNTAQMLTSTELDGAYRAAELAALPLLTLMTKDPDSLPADKDEGWSQLASLERVEIYQATGMVMAQLGVGATAALARLRACAFSNDLTASEVAWRIIERRVTLPRNVRAISNSFNFNAKRDRASTVTGQVHRCGLPTSPPWENAGRSSYLAPRLKELLRSLPFPCG